MPSKASLAIFVCLAYASGAVMSLPVLETRSHHHAGEVATVVTQTTTTTTTVTSAVAVEDKHHHHHHHHHKNDTAAAVDPGHNESSQETPDVATSDASTLHARGWWYDLWHPKPFQHRVPDAAKLSNNNANQVSDFNARAPLLERDYFDDDLW